MLRKITGTFVSASRTKFVAKFALLMMFFVFNFVVVCVVMLEFIEDDEFIGLIMCVFVKYV